jgi:putative transcriptional regulator
MTASTSFQLGHYHDMKHASGMLTTRPSTRPSKPAKVSELRDDDGDLPPMTEEELSRVKIVPRVKSIRRVLKLTQEEFSKRYGIPLGTLRDWEQGAKEPDTTAKSYIRCIMGDAEAVARAYVRIPPAPGDILAG